MVEGLERLLAALEKPLRFASRDGFKNLDKLRDLEGLVSDIELSAGTMDLGKADLEALTGLSAGFKGFDRLPLERRQGIITASLEAIEGIRGNTGRRAGGSAGKRTGVRKATPKAKSKPKSKAAATPPITTMPSDPLSLPLAGVKGIGPKLSAAFAARGMHTIGDLLYYLPRRYQDRTSIKKVSELTPGTVQTVMGEVIISGSQKLRTRTLFKAVVGDGSGTLSLVWFQGQSRYLRTLYKKGARLIVSGEVTYDTFTRSLQIVHPRPENVEFIGEGEESGALEREFERPVPIYPLMEGFGQRRIRGIMRGVVGKYAPLLTDFIPAETAGARGLIPLPDAVARAHFPLEGDPATDLTNQEAVYGSPPHRTLAFTDFFLTELGLAMKKGGLKDLRGIAFEPTGALTGPLGERLGFGLTDAQKRVLGEIEADMRAPAPMSRLLQGDVGSGKTIVALLSMLKAVECGYQAAIMAPTEILAEQHLSSIMGFLDEMGVKVVLLRSSITPRQRRDILAELRTGSARIAVGTHALIQQGVEFARLGFVVIDEQHRFGVLQRSGLIEKGWCPDVLVMTATPIPRTLALTVYGDLDVSVIDEMPPGRKPPQTWVVLDRERTRERAFDLIRGELASGRQGFFVYPLVEGSESDELKHLKDATLMAAELGSGPFRDFNVGLLHGRMHPDEKERVMAGFHSGEVDLLVSTTVIEVGVDMPNATVMVVENAERFGLSQLHQLRGRIARGVHDSHCILFAGERLSDVARRRLEVIKSTTDGFAIAEADLAIRGPGDFLGTKQSGLPQFRFAEILRDMRILGEAREEAFALVRSDPGLGAHPGLRKEVIKLWGDGLGVASA